MLSTAVGLAVALTKGAGFVVSLSNRTVTYEQSDPADSFAGFRLGTDGKIYQRTEVSGASYAEIVSAEWLNPKDAAQADNYEAMMTTVSGTLSTGTAGSWLDLVADQTWQKNQTILGSSSYQGTLQIRRKSDLAVVATATITLTATVTA